MSTKSKFFAGFVELLPQLATMGGKKFRKQLIYWGVEQFGISVAASCAHYNNAKHEASKKPEYAAMMAGLGRAPKDEKETPAAGQMALDFEAAPTKTVVDDFGNEVEIN